MRKINYNIASDKRINYIRLILIGLFTILVSTFFIRSGMNNLLYLNSKTSEKQSMIDNLNSYIDKVSASEEKINREIKSNRSKWEPRIKFINSLIHKKTFPYLTRLSTLEELMPDNAYLRNISIKYGTKNRISLNLEMDSYQTLLEIYKVFGKLDSKFGKETTKDGKYISNMSLVIGNE